MEKPRFQRKNNFSTITIPYFFRFINNRGKTERMVFLVADKGFSHEVCGGSVRDEDEREIFLSKSLFLRKNRYLTS